MGVSTREDYIRCKRKKEKKRSAGCDDGGKEVLHMDPNVEKKEC